ncbi:DUF4351 domain-containing protein, partial [Dolichospermum sp. ST_sed1]|nr:DUF4351 domain-containing protein [Dolichospermum sp. ST_sed1]
RFGKLSSGGKYELPVRYVESINRLTIAQLEDLGEALLDFADINDLEQWLKSYTKL